MNILDKLRAELIDIVEWVDDDRHTLVWRFPRFHNQIKNGAKLVVRPGQRAIFVHEGKIADTFEPGTHTLQTRNLPILSTIAGWSHGFESPFKAEVYFVATRQVTDLKWGTPNPVPMRDADFGPIRVRAFGTYTLCASDPEALLTQLVGTDARFEAAEVAELIRSIVNAEFADLVAGANVPVLDLASNYLTLADQLRGSVADRVQEEFGLDVPVMTIVNISLPADVEQALDARTSMNVVGELGAYQQYQIGAATPVAAANPAGGLAGAGVGVGMGMAMTQGFAPNPGNGGGATTTTTAPVPPPPPIGWHVVVAGEAVGPLAPAQMQEVVARGQVRADTLVWTAGMGVWLPAAQVPAWATLFANQSPPPIPPAQ